MFRSAAESIGGRDRVLNAAAHLAVIVSASLFVAFCARVTLPLPFTPVPLTLQNFGVLLVGLTLGSRRAFAALALYLAEGMMGLPVFNPTGLGGLAQLAGPTGGFLLAYPFVAGVAGLIFECGKHNFARAAIAASAGEIVLFAGGLSWLAILTHSVAQAALFGLYWFVFAEIIKVMLAAGIATGWQRVREVRE
jgi:biotin transport system substrate-specific component